MPKLTTDDIINMWLEPYHGATIEQVTMERLGNPPREVTEEDNRWFYTTYAVTQEQHDEWYERAIELMAKKYRRSKKQIRRQFAMDYLNCAPEVNK